MSTNTTLYEGDYYAWIQRQVEMLRMRHWAGLDTETLIQEISSMGASERRELINRLAVLLAHLLKWQYQPSLQGRSWFLTLKEQRRQLARLLADNPSLHARLSGFIVEAYGDAILMAARETGLNETIFPVECPYSGEQIMDMEFCPGNATVN